MQGQVVAERYRYLEKDSMFLTEMSLNLFLYRSTWNQISSGNVQFYSIADIDGGINILLYVTLSSNTVLSPDDLNAALQVQYYCVDIIIMT